MKTTTRLARAFSAVLALSIPLIAIAPGFAAAASGYVTLSSFSGTPGSSITVSGGGWPHADTVTLYVGSVSGAPAGTGTVDSNGGFSAAITIPASAMSGPLPILAVDTATHEQESNSYYVNPLSPSITITAASHSPFTGVSVSGTGFAPNEIVHLGLAGATSDATASASGAFTGSLTVPAVTPGLYHLNAVGASSGATVPQYSNYFWIDGLYPSISPSAYYLAPGATLSFSGSGFAANETISITGDSGSGTLSSFATNASGAFTAAGGFVVPVSMSGSGHTFTLTGAKSGATASAKITIGSFYPYASPSSYYLTPGSILHVTGGGFAANETIDVFQGTGSSTPASTFTTDSKGSFAAAGSILIPFSAANTQISFTLVGRMSAAKTSVSLGVGGFYPSITPGSYYVVPNASLLVSGSGFAPNETITLSTTGASSTSATADAQGKFSGSITVPFSQTGSATITAVGSLSKASTSVGITLAHFNASVSPSSYLVYPGQMISYHGTGFAPNESIAFVSGAVTSSVSADSSGSFTTASTTVPFNASGSLKATFTGALSGASAQTSVSVGTVSPYLSSDAYSIQQGGIAHVTGSNFAPGETVTVKAGSVTTSTTADATGKTPAVAITAPYGTNSLAITFTGAGSGVSASLTVALSGFTPQVTPSTFYTLPGMPITFTGTGFVPNEKVDVTFNGTAITGATASSVGGFSFSYTPSLLSTSAAFTFKGETSVASIPLTITLAKYTAYIQLSTYYAQGGSPLVVTGSGFAPNETVTLKGNDATFGTATADAKGNVTYSGTVPYGPAGKLVINAIGNGSGASGTTSMTLPQIYTNLQLGSYAGAPGSPITFIGSGYLPNETITITTDRTGSTPVYTFSAGVSGSFNNSGYIVPSTWTGGPLVVTATGNHSFTSTPITYYVTGK